MRRTAIVLTTLFLASTWLGVAAGLTPDEISLDGDMSDWPGDSLESTDSNSVTFRMTWNLHICSSVGLEQIGPVSTKVPIYSSI